MVDLLNPNPGERIIDPFIRITVGKLGDEKGDVFTIGDGKLVKATVTLSEGKTQSNCKFTVYDPDRKLADKYFSYIEKKGGLDPVKYNPPSSTPITSVINPVGAVDQTTASGQLLFSNVIASTYNNTNDPTGGGPIAYDGTTIDFNGMFAAMDVKYLHKKMKVTEISSGRSIIVKVIDTGGFVKSLPDRKIDLVTGAWRALTNGAPDGITRVNIEIISDGTVSTSNTVSQPTKAQAVQQQSQNSKQGTLAGGTINDWPQPQVAATKNIIIFPGHLLDDTSSSGSNGTAPDTTSLTYNGESGKTVEGVLTQVARDVFVSQFSSAGYNIIPAPTVPTSRGQSTRVAYQQAVAALKITSNAYAMELHFDDPTGHAGVIFGTENNGAPGSLLNVMDVALAKSFGSYPYGFRGLSGPSRGVGTLEVAPLDSNLTNLTLTAVSSNNYTALKAALIPYAQKAIAALDTVTKNVPQTQALASTTPTPQQEVIPQAITYAGSQITIEMGYSGQPIAAYTFIHTGLRFSLFEQDSLEFSGQAVTWVLNQRVRNTTYTNVTFKKIAQKITKSYGMNLVMPEDGPLYTYFPQRGLTDYEAILIEARRIGYRVYTIGPTLYIEPRDTKLASKGVFLLEYGSNLGTTFEVNHKAQTDSTGGARSSVPGANNSTGERKFEVDPDTGKVTQKRKENILGTGNIVDKSTSGSPTPVPAPKTTGATDAADNARKESENRIKGIEANAELPTTPEALTLDPDTPLLTKGISQFIDRIWVIDSVTHDYQLGKFITKLNFYSPLKSKSGQPTTAVTSVVNPVGGPALDLSKGAGMFINPMGSSQYNSSGVHQQFGDPNHGGHVHQGQDFGTGTNFLPFYASAAGTVTKADPGGGDNDGPVNFLIISHANGYETRYLHYSAKNVNVGDTVTQGQQIGMTGHTGPGYGRSNTHLHFEIRLNGTPLDPHKFFTI